MSPWAPAKSPSPPVTVHMTAPRVQPAIGLDATVPRPMVTNETAPARPYVMVPSSTNEPSSKRSRSEEHTSELQSHHDLVCRLLLEKKKKQNTHHSLLIP